MNELQKNKRRNVEDFFEYLSSKEELIKYKKAVPFVHILHELIAQWASFRRIEKDWYKEIWTLNEWNDLNSFDQFLNIELQEMPELERNLDVPEIFDSTGWKAIMIKAQEFKIRICKVD